MSSNHVEPSIPDFEIDHSDEYAQYVLDQPQEICFYLKALARQGELINVYLGDGQQSFLSTLLNVDENNGKLIFDPPQSMDLVQQAQQAQHMTLAVRLEQVKILFRVGAPQITAYDNRPALSTEIPHMLLRLQRREFFRLELAGTPPIRCSIHLKSPQTNQHLVELNVLDISAGGLRLEAPTSLLQSLEPGIILQDCRLDIPDEPILLIDLQLLKVVEISTLAGSHKLRLGCSFHGIPAIRLATIEHYIARVERERTAKFSGLAN